MVLDIESFARRRLLVDCVHPADTAPARGGWAGLSMEMAEGAKSERNKKTLKLPTCRRW